MANNWCKKTAILAKEKSASGTIFRVPTFPMSHESARRRPAGDSYIASETQSAERASGVCTGCISTYAIAFMGPAALLLCLIDESSVKESTLRKRTVAKQDTRERSATLIRKKDL